jgi:hypothetical protein
MPDLGYTHPGLCSIRPAIRPDEFADAARVVRGVNGHSPLDDDALTPVVRDADCTSVGADFVTAVSSTDRVIRVSTAIAVLAVAGVGAYVSYWHAYAVVRAHGETGITARLEPATIDGLVYASSMVVLYAARHRLPVPTLARWLLGLGIAATLAANLAQGWSHGPVGAAVAAWPAASLVGSYELLVWLIRTAGAIERGSSAGDISGGEVCCARGRSLLAATADGEQPGYSECVTSGHARESAAQPAGQSAAPAGEQGGDEPAEANAVNEEAVAAYLLSVQAGNPLSERKLARRFGRSRRWARARIADSQQLPRPDNADDRGSSGMLFVRPSEIPGGSQKMADAQIVIT